MLAIEVPQQSRLWLVLAGSLLLICAVGLLVWRSTSGPAPTLSQSTKLKDLPARPEDIEAHGSEAKSVLEPGDARKRNAAVPFLTGPLNIARPFVFRGSDEDRARALECLATAVLYEAGDDTEGQEAVAQVVLNRVRHAAFPATVCGVVYQGSQRSTGCQFTFTCDGSLRRPWPDAAWRRAREVADQALAGSVDRAVGLATHYHTDWVYPYWSPELNKLAKVGTHLFFGWPGRWGGRYAFQREYRGNETKAASMAILAPGATEAAVDIDLGPPKILGLPQPPAQLPPGMGKVPLYGNRLRLVGGDGHSFGLLAASGADSSRLVNAALALCANPGPCRVFAWSNEDDIPSEFPIPAGARGTMIFEYVRDEARGNGSLRFDCGRFPNRDPKRCLAPPQAGPAGLSGVRFKVD